MKSAKVEFSHSFVKSLKKSPQKVKIALRNRLELFLTDKYHPILNNHSLAGRYKNYRSINISGDWRAIFRELDDGDVIYFDFIGTHSQLYK